MNFAEVFLSKIFGTKQERDIRKLVPLVNAINSYEEKMRACTDAELRALTDHYRQRIEDGEELFSLIPETFATVREASRRVINMRHFDVQLMGGVVLFQGKIAEMKTGEGKTLVATLPTYLIGLTGKGVHIVTVNDYLSRRDCQWMGPVYEFLGLSVGVLQNEMPFEERKKAYDADITYGTNSEFGFDYLRDNMAVLKDECVQRKLHYAIVDEVDSILIDEARTPLIISGPAEEATDVYYKARKVVKKLKRDKDFIIDEAGHRVFLTEEGGETVSHILGIENVFAPDHFDFVHYLIQAIRAQYLFRLDQEYIVKEGQVIIVDEFTGRLMPGRRYSDGLHQALEAKEGLGIREEYQTLASITLQNYFRLYSRLAGMTGTAMTEAEEFREIYGLDVVEIPTNKPLNRIELNDKIFKSRKAKTKFIIEEILEQHQQGRPVLVGTTSIEKSEELSKILIQKKVKHEVLNAKHHEKEAAIIARAGEKEAVTIATNMAGRGTDIVLGEGVAELGGLHIIGTERHESRRIDNQLRGRSGRQGDPGSSVFFLSLEDDLIRKFGGDRMQSMADRFGMSDDDTVESGIITRMVEGAQKRVEGLNFEIRKHVLKYDNELEKQRNLIYRMRRELLGDDPRFANLPDTAQTIIDWAFELVAPDKDNWNKQFVPQLAAATGFILDLDYFPFTNMDFKQIRHRKSVYEQAVRFILRELRTKKQNIPDDQFDAYLEKIWLRIMILRTAADLADYLINLFAAPDLPKREWQISEILATAQEILAYDLPEGIEMEVTFSNRNVIREEINNSIRIYLAKQEEKHNISDLIEICHNIRLRIAILKMADNILEDILQTEGEPIKPEEPREAAVKDNQTSNQLSLTPEEMEQRQIKTIKQAIEDFFHFKNIPISNEIFHSEEDKRKLRTELLHTIHKRLPEREQEIGTEHAKHWFRLILLKTIDQKWKEQLRNLDHLREGIGLRAYAQVDPLEEYRREAFEMFNQMFASIEDQVVKEIFTRPLPKGVSPWQPLKINPAQIVTMHPEAISPVQATDEPTEAPKGFLSTTRKSKPNAGNAPHPVPKSRFGKSKIGPNEPCYCGSGKKYKKCCRAKDIKAQARH